MTKLTSKARDAIPDSKFAGPGRSYPIEDKAHARNAKARASEEEHKGKLSPEEKAKIDAKADKVLGEAKPLTDVLGELFQPNPDPKMRPEPPDQKNKFLQVNNVASDGKAPADRVKRFTDIDPSTLDDKLFNASNIKTAKYNRAPQKDTVVGEAKETKKLVPHVPLARKPMCEVLGLQEAAKAAKKPAKKTPEEEDGDIEAKHEKTLQEHTKAMKRARAEDHSFGWSQDFGPDKSTISSKTSKGMLTTCHEHGTGRITHEWGEAK